MRVVDAEGQFVGFVKDIVGQNLLIGRPLAQDIEVPIASCRMSGDEVELHMSKSQIETIEGS